MAKVYIANTPLILQDGQGKEFRVETGEAVELTPAQYELVAAHVTPTLTTGEELEAQQDEQTPPEAEAEAQEQTPPESGTAAESESKTQRKTKAAA